MAGAAAAQSTDAYFEFLMARRLEAQGDQAGALAALERAAAADPASAEVRAEIASFQLRRNRRTDAETAALQALKLDDGQPRSAPRARPDLLGQRRRHERADAGSAGRSGGAAGDHPPRARGRRGVGRHRHPDPLLARAPLPSHRRRRQGGRRLHPRRQPESRFGAGASLARAGVRGVGRPEERHRDARIHRQRRAARGGRAGAVPGAGRAAEGSDAKLHGARSRTTR